MSPYSLISVSFNDEALGLKSLIMAMAKESTATTVKAGTHTPDGNRAQVHVLAEGFRPSPHMNMVIQVRLAQICDYSAHMSFLHLHVASYENVNLLSNVN